MVGTPPSTCRYMNVLQPRGDVHVGPSNVRVPLTPPGGFVHDGAGDGPHVPSASKKNHIISVFCGRTDNSLSPCDAVMNQ